MLDPDAATGSFGLVMCSGFGPMFPDAVTNVHHSAMQKAGMADMGGMTGAMPAVDENPSAHGAMGDNVSNHSAGLCAFSAAYLTAVLSVFLLGLIVCLSRVVRFWHSAYAFGLARLTRFCRPLSHGPPATSSL